VSSGAAIKDFTFAQDLLARQKSMASQDSAGTISWWHNDVCRSRELNGGNVSAAASRYEMKYVKLQQLENTLQSDECSKGVSCPKSWIEFKSRVTHFESCVAVFNQEHETNGEASPASVLVKTMTSEERKRFDDMAEEDKKTKERIDAKNAFDGYLHSMRSAIEGSGGLGDKLEADEKSTVMDAVKEGQSWLDSNTEADVDEIKQKEQEIKDICAPIMSKYYGQAGGGGEGGADAGSEDEGEYDEL